jgi:hypothetical protein
MIRKKPVAGLDPVMDAGFPDHALNRGIAAANLGNTVPVLAIIIIDRLHIEEHELLPGVRIGCPRFRVQLELFFDKNRHCVGIIGNNAPQVVVGQV